MPISGYNRNESKVKDLKIGQFGYTYSTIERRNKTYSVSPYQNVRKIPSGVFTCYIERVPGGVVLDPKKTYNVNPFYGSRFLDWLFRMPAQRVINISEIIAEGF